ncbi:MAG: SDR family NAD(P)-dependent oxidoreductase [Myxococcales bacterium]|nr:SDR family NAD(P)-dependent oxidoreductase [Myxococcales bacterium]
MASELRYDGKVAIITGAGNGLGRSHALLLASRGAKVVVNDLGGDAHGGGKGSAAADAVVSMIREAGGEAVANYNSVTDGDKIVQTAIDAFGRVDIIVNNAGILRDTSFQKMSDSDWDLIYQVHVLGAYKVTHAAWPYMRDQGYGRIIMTASAAGIYGNFGQANYSMAKLGVVGFANTLAIEGKKRGVYCNTIAPIAGSRMTETVLPKELIDALRPEYVSPLVAWLTHESCEENGSLFEVGGGYFGKLRWERTEGATIRLGRDISPEDIADRWATIVDFGKSTHPREVTEALAPVMANVQAGPSKGGNKFIDVDLALGHEAAPIHSEYNEHDLALYALGVGAAADPLDDSELRYVFEMHQDGFIPLPTYGVIPGVNAILDQAKKGVMAPGLNFGLDRLLHGEQYTELRRPLPPHAKLTHHVKVKDIFDKGKHATVIFSVSSVDESGEELIYNELTALIRGAGGWGGDRGPQGEVNVPPEREPDGVVTETIAPNQALLYRLSGDWNPLHADPNFARAFGFDRPILHGLCTFGYAGRAILRELNDDPRKFKSIKVRFADSVFPGETLVTEMWVESPTRVIFRCKVAERDSVVISHAAIELYAEIPKPKAKPKAAPSAQAQAAAPVKAEPNSADVFAAIADYVAKSDEAKKIGVTYLFKIQDPASTWTLDLKAAKVGPGETAKPECTLEIAEADFMAMCEGKVNPNDLYFGGKLKITGNVLASQKLFFLQKIDPAVVKKAAEARVAGAGGGGAAAAAPVSAEPTSADIFVAMGEYVGQNADAKKIGLVYQFKLTDPASVWTLDLKEGKVAPGETQKPECTLEITDADFMAMCAGKANPQELYFGGKLKIGGNVMASQKLTFLQKIDPAAVERAAKARVASGGASPAAAASAPVAAGPGASEIFEALHRRLADNPGLGAEVDAILNFLVRSPDSNWTVTLQGEKVSVDKGESTDAIATLTLAEDDLIALAKGESSARDLFQRGRLRVDGEVRVAQRLGFFNKLI